MTTATADEIRARTRAFLLERLRSRRDFAELDDEAPLAGALDSVRLLELTLFLEKAFGVAVAARDLEPVNFGSVNRIVRYVLGRR